MSTNKTWKCPNCGYTSNTLANKCIKCGKIIEKTTFSNSNIYTKSSSNTQNSLDINSVDSDGFSAMLNEDINSEAPSNDDKHPEGRKSKRFNIFGRKHK